MTSTAPATLAPAAGPQAPVDFRLAARDLLRASDRLLFAFEEAMAAEGPQPRSGSGLGAEAGSSKVLGLLRRIRALSQDLLTGHPGDRGRVPDRSTAAKLVARAEGLHASLSASPGCRRYAHEVLLDAQLLLLEISQPTPGRVLVLRARPPQAVAASSRQGNGQGRAGSRSVAPAMPPPPDCGDAVAEASGAGPTSPARGPAVGADPERWVEHALRVAPEHIQRCDRVAVAKAEWRDRQGQLPAADPAATRAAGRPAPLPAVTARWLSRRPNRPGLRVVPPAAPEAQMRLPGALASAPEEMLA